MFQNIQHFGKENRRVVANDFGYEQADIIFLVECHNLSSHRGEIEKVFKNTHDLIHFTAGTDNFTSNGQVCYVRKNVHKNRMRFLAHNANDFNEYGGRDQNKITELSLFEYKFNSEKVVYILSVYKHPMCSNEKCLSDINRFLLKNLTDDLYTNERRNLFILGDFNIDFNLDKNKKWLDYLGNNIKMKPLFTNDITFKNLSQLDWAFVNKDFKHKISSSIYDTWFSDHSAIWTQIDFN